MSAPWPSDETISARAWQAAADQIDAVPTGEESLLERVAELERQVEYLMDKDRETLS